MCGAVGELTVAGVRLRARIVRPRRRNVPGDKAEIMFVVCMRFHISILYAGDNAYLSGIPLRMDFVVMSHCVSFCVYIHAYINISQRLDAGNICMWHTLRRQEMEK